MGNPGEMEAIVPSTERICGLFFRSAQSLSKTAPKSSLAPVGSTSMSLPWHTHIFPENGKFGRNGDYRAANREDLGAVFPFRAKSLQNSPQILPQPGRFYKHELALAYAYFFGKREIRGKRRLSCRQPGGFAGCFSVPRKVSPKQPPNPPSARSVLQAGASPSSGVPD